MLQKCFLYKAVIILTLSYLLLGTIPVYSNNTDYYKGYVKAVIDDFLLGENARTIIKKRMLEITFFCTPLGPQTEQKLKNRLEKLQYFKVIKIKYINENPYIKSDSNNSPNSENTEFLPSGAIYDAPLADPRWPTFSAGYLRYLRNGSQKNVFSLAFGDNLALTRYKSGNFTYELGLQAGLFGLIDFSKAPTKLINSDYFVGAGISILHNNHWQNLIQFSHLSSHLGDEILINNEKLVRKRINLSYEALKWFTAYKFKTFRPYLGVGFLMDRDPSTIKPLTIEEGIDYVSQHTFLWNTGRFVCGIHIHHWQENKFKPSLNIRPGVQFENPKGNGRFLRFMLDYSYGNSRHGQFYYKKEQYIGLLVTIAS